MVADHKQLKGGLEQSFYSASNRPYQGTVNVSPYVDAYGQQHYGVTLQGADMETAEAFYTKFSKLGGKRPPTGKLPFGPPAGTPDAKQPAAPDASKQLTDPNIDKFLQ